MLVLRNTCPKSWNLHHKGSCGWWSSKSWWACGRGPWHGGSSPWQLQQVQSTLQSIKLVDEQHGASKLNYLSPTRERCERSVWCGSCGEPQPLRWVCWHLCMPTRIYNSFHVSKLADKIKWRRVYTHKTSSRMYAEIDRCFLIEWLDTDRKNQCYSCTDRHSNRARTPSSWQTECLADRAGA